jgi:hypothetical protein
MGKEVELSGLSAKKMERTPRFRYTFGLRSAGGHLIENKTKINIASSGSTNKKVYKIIIFRQVLVKKLL